MRKFPKKVTIPIVVIIPALVIILVGGYYLLHVYDYIQNDPSFCQSCHIMETSWDRWATSAHKVVGCHSCHEQSAVASFVELVGVALGKYERVEKHAIVPDEACKECHESGSARWIQVEATAGHKIHAEEQNIACVKCHSVSVHRFAPPGAVCNLCHEEQVKVNGMASMHCTTCHQFLVEGEPLLPNRKDCLDCHQALTELGVTWPADAPMQYPCGKCHQPHQQTQPVVDCLSCHTEGGLHLTAAHRASSCQTCHKPHEWRVTQRETCLTCHPEKAEHNPGILCGSCHGFPGS